MDTKDIKHLKNEDQFMWSLIQAESVWYWQVLGFLGIWAVYVALFLPTVHPIGAIIFGATFMLQIYLHECGHALVYSGNGIKTKIWIVFPMGAVTGGITPEEDAKSKAWTKWNIGLVTLAGVSVNALLILVGAGLTYVANIYVYIAGVGLIMNGALSVVLNLLPIWQVDGSIAQQSSFESLAPLGDRRFAAVITLVSIVMVEIAFIFPGVAPVWATFYGAIPMIYKVSWILLPGLLIGSTFFAYRRWKDEPVAEKAMTWYQVIIQTAILLVIFYIGMIALFGI